MPTFYNLDAKLPRFIYGSSEILATPYPDHVRANDQRYIFSWVKAHYDICCDPSYLAFAGLSLGGWLT